MTEEPKPKDPIKVVDWIPYELAEEKQDCGLGGLGGWARGNTWHDYLEQWKPHMLPYLEALRESIVENRIRFGGDDHQSRDDGAPLFSDGTVATYSYRAWGDLLSCIWNTEEGHTQYGYMNFYMGCLTPDGSYMGCLTPEVSND